MQNYEFIKGIEDLGAIVVVDELCTGARYCWNPVDTSIDTDPLEAISKRYLNGFPCARMVPPTDRINQVIRNCAPIAHDQPLLAEKLKENGVPVIELDLEYGEGFSGQIRTRVEAFLEKFIEM